MPTDRLPVSRRAKGPRLSAARAAGLAGAAEAIRSGLHRLERMIQSDGAWPVWIYRDIGDGESIDPDYTPPETEGPTFSTALGVLALANSEEPAAARIRVRGRTFLWNRMEFPGVWRYWRVLPPDLDSTAMGSLAAPEHPWIILGRSRAPILDCLDDDGRFRTWMLGLVRLSEEAEGMPLWDDVDPVVNANVLAWLGDRPETRRAQRWLEALVVENREEGASRWWYTDPLALHVAMARAHACAPPVFADVKSVLAARILEQRDSAGCFGDATRTAQALTALDALDDPACAEMAPALEYLIAAQREDGSWPTSEFYRHYDLTTRVGCEALTTGLCIEALTRYRIRH